MLKLLVKKQFLYWMQNSNVLILSSRRLCISTPMVDMKSSEKSSTQPTTLTKVVFEALNNKKAGQITSEDSNIKLPTEQFIELRKQMKISILAAKDIPTLLSLSEKEVTQQEALQILSKLINWASRQQVKLSDFETDTRFKQLCKLAGKQTNSLYNSYTKMNNKSEDLSTVLGVTGDDEAAKLIANLSIPQMIKVMSNLALKKRRSTPLLRALSYNISRHSESIDLKRCADLLYSMSILNFPDPVLIERIFMDVEGGLSNNLDRTSVISSIMTSIGMLKYKNEKTLNMLLEWISKNCDAFRSHDIVSIVFTMANLNHCPTECGFGIEKLFKLEQSECPKATSWLDYVWSLVVLNQATVEQVSSVLKPEFIESLKIGEDVPFSSQKRLCNINGYATVMKNYKGSLLPKDYVNGIEIIYSKEKIVFVNLLLETLKSLLSSDANLKKNCNSNMGFLYDAECLLDSKCNPYPLNSSTNKKNLIKVAILAVDYHDFCKGTDDDITGSVSLYKHLLEAQGYSVVLVSYREFSPRDNLANRVRYIENILKQVVSQSSSVKK